MTWQIATKITDSWEKNPHIISVQDFCWSTSQVLYLLLWQDRKPLWAFLQMPLGRRHWRLRNTQNEGLLIFVPSTHHLIHRIVVVFLLRIFGLAHKCWKLEDMEKIVTISFLGHLVFFWVGFPFKLCCVFFFWKILRKAMKKDIDTKVIIWDFEQRKEIHRLSLHKVVRKTQRKLPKGFGILGRKGSFFVSEIRKGIHVCTS